MADATDNIAKALGYKESDEDVAAIFADMDSDHSGALTIDEIMEAMKKLSAQAISHSKRDYRTVKQKYKQVLNYQPFKNKKNLDRLTAMVKEIDIAW